MIAIAPYGERTARSARRLTLQLDACPREVADQTVKGGRKVRSAEFDASGFPGLNRTARAVNRFLVALSDELIARFEYLVFLRALGFGVARARADRPRRR